MRAFLRRLFGPRSRNGGEPVAATPVDPAVPVEAIRRAESGATFTPGKRIHRFEAAGLDLRVDYDVTHTYRITASEGTERRYSFSVRAPARDYDALHEALATVLAFLEGDRHPSRLPDTALVKGHYYGSGA